jgi:hypothetical protein
MPRLICGSRHPRGCLSLAAGLGHRIFQHLLVELDADLADMARLLVAQEIAGPPDIEIVARQREAGAELVQGLHHLEPLLGGGRELALRRQGQIGIAAQLGAPIRPRSW